MVTGKRGTLLTGMMEPERDVDEAKRRLARFTKWPWTTFLTFPCLERHHLLEKGEAQLGLGICEVWVFWGLFHFVLGSLFMIIQTTSKCLNFPLLSWLWVTWHGVTRWELKIWGFRSHPAQNQEERLPWGGCPVSGQISGCWVWTSAPKPCPYDSWHL